MKDTKKVIEKIFSDAQDSLVIQSSDLSLESISAMVESASINVEPKYQRRERWTQVKQSALIESFLLNVPVPPVYLAEDEYGVYSVIDGKQRLISITQFMTNRLMLSGLEKFKEIDGLYFRDLPKSLSNALRIRPYLRIITLLKQSDKNLKYEVFLRLNRGGEPLLPQEIRNVAYRGKLNDLIFRLAKHDFLLQQLKIRKRNEKQYKQMVDVEYVLRFLVVNEYWENFSGKMNKSMDEFMEQYKNAPPLVLRRFERQFNRTLDRCNKIWGDKAFKRPSGNKWINLVIQGMYDAQMVGVNNLTENEAKNAMNKKRKVISKMTEKLSSNSTFEDYIRQFTSNPERMKYRIEEMTNILKNV